MSTPSAGGRWFVPMTARSPEEPHRAATPLELFFDLVFVVAVAQAAGRLHHAVSAGHLGEALLAYGMVFFAIWWAWMNFTWFASAYDTDDVAYRLMVFVQLTGALIFAAGVATAFDERDFTVCTLGYVVMRVALVTQWLRAAHADPARRRCTLRYALGVTVCQIGWVALLLAPQGWKLPGFLVLAAAELAVPAWAEHQAPTSWHAGHVTERYGLFTIIVLGESVLAATVAAQTAVAEGGHAAGLWPIVAGGLLVLFALWWFYFYRPVDDLLRERRDGPGLWEYGWGYGHLLVFASAAAVGAGIAVNVDRATHHAAIGQTTAGATVAVPVAVYLLVLWLLHRRPGMPGSWLTPFVALLVLATPWTPQPIFATGLLLAALLAVKLASRHREEAAGAPS